MTDNYFLDTVCISLAVSTFVVLLNNFLYRDNCKKSSGGSIDIVVRRNPLMDTVVTDLNKTPLKTN
jgi:hypothetical protein